MRSIKSIALIHRLIILAIILLPVLSCNPTTGVFEKNVAIPGHEWSSDFIPEIKVNIEDTLSQHNIYVVIRHADAYRFNNLWINLQTQVPGEEIRTQKFDLRLATDDKGWLGSGMDDIYEHRVLIAPVRFPKKGTYIFRIEQIMRIDPLPHILNAGIRIEKSS